MISAGLRKYLEEVKPLKEPNVGAFQLLVDKLKLVQPEDYNQDNINACALAIIAKYPSEFAVHGIDEDFVNFGDIRRARALGVEHVAADRQIGAGLAFNLIFGYERCADPSIDLNSASRTPAEQIGIIKIFVPAVEV